MPGNCFLSEQAVRYNVIIYYKVTVHSLMIQKGKFLDRNCSAALTEAESLLKRQTREDDGVVD